jgi:hypothetical protein
MTPAPLQHLAAQARELGGDVSFTFMQELENAAQYLQDSNRDLGLHYLRLSESHLHQALSRLQQLIAAVEAAAQ